MLFKRGSVEEYENLPDVRQDTLYLVSGYTSEEDYETGNYDCAFGFLGNLMIKFPTEDSSNMETVTYSQLKSLRNRSLLVPGKFYRLTDYYATTSDIYHTSAVTHNFDIIIYATDESHLSEQAWATRHGANPLSESYFSNNNLSAWELKYCLDNDASRFNWALGATITVQYSIESRSLTSIFNRNVAGDIEVNDTRYYEWVKKVDDEGFFKIYTESETPVAGDSVYTFDGSQLYNFGRISAFNPDGGHGVIYYMKDEFGNEADYDFKNIMLIDDRQYFELQEPFFTFSLITRTGNTSAITDLSLLQSCSNNKISCTITSPRYIGVNIFVSYDKNPSIIGNTIIDTKGAVINQSNHCFIMNSEGPILESSNKIVALNGLAQTKVKGCNNVFFPTLENEKTYTYITNKIVAQKKNVLNKSISEISSINGNLTESASTQDEILNYTWQMRTTGESYSLGFESMMDDGEEIQILITTELLDHPEETPEEGYLMIPGEFIGEQQATIKVYVNGVFSSGRGTILTIPVNKVTELNILMAGNNLHIRVI